MLGGCYCGCCVQDQVLDNVTASAWKDQYAATVHADQRTTQSVRSSAVSDVLRLIRPGDGDLTWPDALLFANHDLPSPHSCPSFTNPAEYFIAVVQEADAVYQLADSFDQAMGKLLQPVASGSYSPTAAPSRAASTAASTPATAAAAAAAALPVPTWHAGAAGLATSSSASVQVQQQGQDGSREMQYGMRSSTCTLPGQASASSGSDVARPAGLLEEEEEEGGGEQQAQTPVWHQVGGTVWHQQVGRLVNFPHYRTVC